MGDNNKVFVEAIGVYRLLKLESCVYMNLNEIVYVPSFRRNLIYVFNLDKSSYICSFGNGGFSFFQNSNIIVRTGSLVTI